METIPATELAHGTLHRPGTWVVAFLASWCPFCRAFRPEYERLARELPVGIGVVDVSDVDCPIWDRFRLEVVPTVVVFREGRAVFRQDGRPGEGLGERDLAQLREALERFPPPSEAAGRPH